MLLKSFGLAAPWWRRFALLGFCVALALGRLVAAEAPRKEFHVPAGDAAATLGEFAKQSGEQIVFLVDNVRGQRTKAIDGELNAFVALQQMLLGTNLTAHRDPSNGTMTVARRPEPRPEEKPPAPKPETPPKPLTEEVVRLSEFTVSGAAVDRYRAADAISGVRVRTALIDTPSSISVMTRDAIDDLAPMRIFDVTRYIAGIEEGRGIQFADRQIIRGFESNGRTVDNFFQAGADNFDEALIDRIEVSKGPNAILAPAGVPGGSINVITKTPQFTRRHTLTALAGLFDAQKITIDLTGPLPANGDIAYRVVAAAQDSRRYWAADARLRGKVFAPMVTWRASEHTMLTLKLMGVEHWIFREPGLILDPRVDYGTDPPVLAPGFSYKSRNGIQPWSHVGTRTWDAFALLTTHLNRHVSVRVAANGRYYYEDSTQEFFSTPTLTNRYNPTTGVLTPDQIWSLDPVSGNYLATSSPFFNPTAVPVRGDTQATTVVTVNGQADLAAVYRFGHVGSQTVIGGAVNHFDSIGRNHSGVLPPLDLTRTDFLANAVWSPAFSADNRAKQNTRQIYLNQRLTFLDDRLQLTAGALHYSVYTKNRTQLDPAARPSVLDDDRALWLASLLFKPRPNVSLYYTRSTNSTPIIANDLPLWRDGEQDEIGLKTEFFRQRLGLNLAWFRIKQNNVIVPNPDHQTDPAAPEQLISDLRDRGFELELTGGITPNLSVIAAYTALRLRDSLGRPVRAVADRNASVLLNYRRHLEGGRRFSLSLGVSHAGARPGDATGVNFTPLGVATKQSFKIPSYVVTNLGASYKWDRYLVRLNIDNFLDDKNYLQQAGGRVSGTGLTTATGLNLKLSTTIEF
jgi:iron complex outermembrane receptor protein